MKIVAKGGAPLPNNSLSISYENNFKNKKAFLIKSKALVVKKLIKKKQFPFFGIGSIISFFISFMAMRAGFEDWALIIFFTFLLASLVLGIIGLVIGEFVLWSILGIVLSSLMALLIIVLVAIGRPLH
jgi:hypothetical protein